MPFINILEVDLFNIWGIDFMCPFVYYFNSLCILLVVDYVSKYVEVVVVPTNDTKSMLKFLSKNIFTKFGTTIAIISKEGSHFYNR